MDRPSRDDVLMGTARQFARRSTCSRLNVGAVIARDGRVLVTGYNGAPAGMPHCEHDTYDIMASGEPVPIHTVIRDATDEGCQIAGHAEENAIAFAAKHGVSIDGAELLTTHAPCFRCARLIINAGIRRVVYDIPYRLTDGIDLLSAASVRVDRFQ